MRRIAASLGLSREFDHGRPKPSDGADAGPPTAAPLAGSPQSPSFEEPEPKAPLTSGV